MATQPPRLVCYTVSDSDSDSEQVDCVIKSEPDAPPVTANSIVTSIIYDVLHQVVNGTRDFSDMFIKEEPIDVDYIKQELNIDDVYREGVKIEIDSEDSDDSDNESSFIGEEPAELSQEGTRHGPPRTKNELTLADLPPVQDLDVSLPESEVVKIGTVSSIVDELVVIESLPDNPAIDLDSVLFLDSGRRALGHVFDVIGPVRKPYYCVRFNSKNHIEEKQIFAGVEVFYAPKSEYTNFVFLDQLMKLKISDASWRDDEEPPPQFLDYSDDEDEKRAKQDRVIEKMRENGATEEEVQRKKARYEGASRGRGTHKRGMNSRNIDTHDGNMHYNNQRYDNGLYNSSTNPFYRQSRSYNPRDMGPIRWSGYMPEGQQYQSNSGNVNENLQYNSYSMQSSSPAYSTVPRGQQRYSTGPHGQSGYGTAPHGQPGYNTNHNQGYFQNHNSYQHRQNNAHFQQNWWNPPPPPPGH